MAAESRLNAMANAIQNRAKKQPTAVGNGRLAEPAELLDRMPPADVQMERALLSCLMLDGANGGAKFAEVVNALNSVDDLYDHHCRRVYEAMQELHRNGQPAEPLLVHDRLVASGALGDCGVSAFLADLAEIMPTSDNAIFFARQIADKAKLRRLREAGEEIIRISADGSRQGATSAIEEASTTFEHAIRNPKEVASERFRIFSSAQLDELEFGEQAIIKNAKIENQPAGVFGGTKTLKTCIAADGAFSVATCTNFLDCDFFIVPRPRRVMFMSAESGLKAIQRLARRIARARGYELAEIENLLWCPTVPFIGDDRDCKTISKLLKDNGIEWAIFDPLYMMLDGRDANNLYSQGVQFRRLQEACHYAGADFDLLHHNSRASARVYDPPTLNDAQWSGIAEFVGQWWQLGRREKYEEGSGIHRLWFSAGARGDFQNLWAIDVDEHSDESGRPQGWSVTVRPATEAHANTSEGDKAQRADAKFEADVEKAMKRIVGALMKFPNGETEREIRRHGGLDGGKAVREAFARLLNDNQIESYGIPKGGRKEPYPGFRIINSEV